MRLIINGFFDNPSLNQAFVKIIQQFPIKKCHVFTHLDEMTRDSFRMGIKSQKNIDFHDFQQTITGTYSNINWSEVTPLDEALIYKMVNCETVVLKMMDRLSSDSVTYEERKRLYLRHLRYWNHIITQENIDLFIATGIPHEIYDFIIYSLCNLKNIPSLLITHSPIDGVVFISNDWEQEPAKSITKTYNQIINEKPEKIYLSERFRDHYIRQISQEKDPIPWYMASNFNPNFTKNRLSIKTLKKFFVLLKKFFKDQKVVKEVVKKLAKQIKNIPKNRERVKLFEFYDHNSVDPDLNQKYIYLPLHYQPECTTSPMAGAFVDQLLIVQMIAALLPSNIYIYVKEHPFQTFHCRNINFYRDLIDIPQVRLVSREYNSFRLLENCLAVATATGTAGWEGLFRQKPILMFGHYLYQYAPKVFAIHNLANCKEALDEIIGNNIKPSLYEMEIFLKAMETHAVIAYADIAYSHVSQISNEDNTNNLFSALRQKFIDLGFALDSNV